MGDEEVRAASSTLCMPYGHKENKAIAICCTSHSPLQQKPPASSATRPQAVTQQACSLKLIPPFKGIWEKKKKKTHWWFEFRWKCAQTSSTNMSIIAWLGLLPDHSVDLVNSNQLGRHRAAGMSSKVIQRRAYGAKTRQRSVSKKKQKFAATCRQKNVLMRVDRRIWTEDFITATRADRQQFPSCGFCHTSGKWM